jgi:hypothetical protein
MLHYDRQQASGDVLTCLINVEPHYQHYQQLDQSSNNRLEVFLVQQVGWAEA